MSPFKKAAVKGGNSKGKEHMIVVDDLSPIQKGQSHHQEYMIPTNSGPLLLFSHMQNIPEMPNHFLKRL